MGILKFISSVALVATLVACGGGGGSSGTVAGGTDTTTTQALFTTAPSTTTLNTGATISYQIGGGSSPYAVASDTPANVSATVSGSTLTLSALQGGTAGITVTDSKGTKVSLSVSVPLPGALFSTAPSGLTLTSGQSNTFIVGGGVPGYTVQSSNSSLITTSLVGTNLILSAPATSSTGTAVISLVDSKGTILTFQVSVVTPTPGAMFTTAPSSITLAVGQSNTFSIVGGLPSYVSSSTNENVATVSLVGTSIKVTAGATPGVATITTIDAKGTVVSFSVTVPAPGALFTTAPALVTLAGGQSNTFLIGGGSGTYSVQSSNTALVTASSVGANLTVSAVAGSVGGTAIISLSDSRGTIVSFSVAVPAPGALSTTAPAALTMNIGQPNTFLISGGVGPYTAQSSNTSVVIVGVSGSSLTLTPGGASGTATVSVLDSKGTLVNLSITVAAPGALFTTAPAAVSVSVSATPVTYSIAGGTPPYIASSGNTSVVKVSTSGSNGQFLDITGLNVGVSTVNIFDSKGSSVSVAVTVASAGSLFTTAPAAVTMSAGQISAYLISGGAPGYTMASSNNAVATVSPTVGGMTITALKAGSANIVITDTKGANITVSIVVPTIALTSTIPTGLTLDLDGQTYFYSANGGQPFVSPSTSQYTVASSNASVLKVVTPVGTSAIQLTPVSAGTANVVITDANGTSLSVPVTVNPPPALRITVPPTLNLVAGGSISGPYSIAGGVPYADGYRVVSDAPLVMTTTLASDGKSVSVSPLAAGTANIFVSDSRGTVVSFAAVVTNPVPLTSSAATVNLVPGNSAVITISGGLPSLSGYAVTSSSPTVALASVTNGKFVTISGVAPGQTTLTVKDSLLSVLTVSVTVAPTAPLYTTAPTTASISIGGAGASYLVDGGTAPYTCTTSDTSIVTSTCIGKALSIIGVGGGAATVRITDSVGANVSFAVNVGGSSNVSAYPTVAGGLPDSASNPSNSIAASGYTDLKISLKDPSGLGIPNQPIDIAPDAKLVFPDGNTALTNASGVATFRVGRASLLVAGAGAISASYSYKSGLIPLYPSGAQPPAAAQVITTYIGYQLSSVAVNLSFTTPNPVPATVDAYSTTSIVVHSSVTTTPVLVNFSASCGQVLPASATTSSNGDVSVTYSATDAPSVSASTLGCGGKSVEITASTAGATPQTLALKVKAAAATNLSFVGASPARIYLGNSGGPTQSTLSFKLVNSKGEAVTGQDVNLSLVSQALSQTKASFDTVGNTSDVVKTTDSSGLVSVPVFSGDVPTSAVVHAQLVSASTVKTDSSVLTIASGRPRQSGMSLALGKLAIRGFNFDGDETTVTISLSDRQGNPVPDGTAVNFVTEGGVMIPPTCTTGSVAGDSRCVVTIRSQNPRPADGRVSILAYAAGEEDFVDANFNNVYDCGEAFFDLGTAFRDNAARGSTPATEIDTVNGQGPLPSRFTAGAFSVPRNADVQTCGALPAAVTPTPGHGDNVWGSADVRVQSIIVFSTDDFVFVNPTFNGSSMVVTVQDLNANSVPSGSTIVGGASDGTPNNGVACSLIGVSNSAVPNTLEPLTVTTSVKNCLSGDSVQLTVTTPAFTKTFVYNIP